jgi:putative addiction module component (TIGR02574 family)
MARVNTVQWLEDASSNAKEHRMNPHPEFAALFELPIAERLQLVEDLWDSIAAQREQEPLPAAVVAELRARKAAFDADPTSGIPWEEVKRQLRGA